MMNERRTTWRIHHVLQPTCKIANDAGAKGDVVDGEGEREQLVEVYTMIESISQFSSKSMPSRVRRTISIFSRM